MSNRRERGHFFGGDHVAQQHEFIARISDLGFEQRVDGLPRRGFKENAHVDRVVEVANLGCNNAVESRLQCVANGRGVEAPHGEFFVVQVEIDLSHARALIDRNVDRTIFTDEALDLEGDFTSRIVVVRQHVDADRFEPGGPVDCGFEDNVGVFGDAELVAHDFDPSRGSVFPRVQV